MAKSIKIRPSILTNRRIRLSAESALKVITEEPQIIEDIEFRIPRLGTRSFGKFVLTTKDVGPSRKYR